MTGNPGPYTNDDGDVWVPRIVPWMHARAVAAAAAEQGDVLRYVGKEDVPLFGFTRDDCQCEGMCRLADTEADDFDPAIEDACIVPAWHFRQGDSYNLPTRIRSPR